MMNEVNFIQAEELAMMNNFRIKELDRCPSYKC